MIRALVVVVLIACGGGAATKKLHIDYAFVPEPEHSGIVRGIITTDAGQPAIGATCAIKHTSGEVVRITEIDGTFQMDQALPEGNYTLVVYYGDTKASHPIQVRAGHVTVVRVTNLREPPGGELLE